MVSVFFQSISDREPTLTGKSSFLENPGTWVVVVVVYLDFFSLLQTHGMWVVVVEVVVVVFV